MNILLIDDDKLILTVVSKKLKDNGHKVLTAEDGEKALTFLENQKFDLIISDVMMPGISGLTLVSILKTYHLSTIPLILISTLNQINVITQSLKLGAIEFISKPINFALLGSKIRQIEQGRKF